MTDDWDSFSAGPYQQPEQPSPGMSPIALATYPFLVFDWPDQLSVVVALLGGGKKAIWFDLLRAQETGLSGQTIQRNLNRQGIVIHARAFYPTHGTIAAIIVVDAEAETRARKALTKMGVLLF